MSRMLLIALMMLGSVSPAFAKDPTNYVEVRPTRGIDGGHGPAFFEALYEHL